MKLKQGILSDSNKIYFKFGTAKHVIKDNGIAKQISLMGCIFTSSLSVQANVDWMETKFLYFLANLQIIQVKNE